MFILCFHNTIMILNTVWLVYWLLNSGVYLQIPYLYQYDTCMLTCQFGIWLYRKIISLGFLETVCDSKVTDKHQTKQYTCASHLSCQTSGTLCCWGPSDTGIPALSMMQGFGLGRLKNPCGLSEGTLASCGTAADGLICHMRKHQMGMRKRRKRKMVLVA